MALPQSTLDRIQADYPALSPQLQLAAKYLLDNPDEVAMRTMRRVANQANVAPSTMVRLARALGYGGYDELREEFQEALREHGFGDRAAQLQTVARGGGAANLIGTMLDSSVENLRSTTHGLDPALLERAAEMLRRAKTGYIVGASGIYGIASYFYSVGRMLLPNLKLVGGNGSSLVDGLLYLGEDDVVLVMSFHPYARQTVESLDFIRSRGPGVIAVTDSLASPLAQGADVVLKVETQGLQFFPSQVGAVCVLEYLASFIISGGGKEALDHVHGIDELRTDQNLYWFSPDRGGRRK